MLKTVTQSANRKTGPIAVTYRAGAHNVFATCPATCALNPQGQHAAERDERAVHRRRAVADQPASEAARALAEAR